jgi:hypothetical protein
MASPAPRSSGRLSSSAAAFLDDGEEFFNVDQVDRSLELKAETAPDHRSGRQYPLFILVEALQGL